MSIPYQRLPEPTLSETELIRAADTLPELSTALRSRTFLRCQEQVVCPRNRHRFRLVSAAGLVVSAVFAILYVCLAMVAEGPLPSVHVSDGAPSTKVRPWLSGSDQDAGPVISLGNHGMIPEERKANGVID